MNFDFLVESVVAEHKGKKVTKALAKEMITGVFDDIVMAIKSGQKLHIKNFGTFLAVETAPRTFIEPRDKREIKVGKVKRPRFLPSLKLKALLKEEGEE